jgi:hypothetical protein
MRTQAWRAILWGGLIAGTLDLTAAFVLSARRGRSPVQVLHSIASGLLGNDSFAGGAATAVLGGVLHFLIALTWAAVYWAVSRRLRALEQAARCVMHLAGEPGELAELGHGKASSFYPTPESPLMR